MIDSPTRRDREKNAMKNLILQTAMNLFTEKGYENVSLRNLADKIEYSPATVYNYFKDKNEILFTLHNMAFGMFYAALNESLSISDPLERLHDMGKRYIDFALTNPEYYDLMFIMDSPMKKVESPADWEAGLSSYKLLEDTVAECIKAGYFKANDPAVPTYAMWSFPHGLVSLSIRKRTVMIPEEKLRPLLLASLDFIFEMFKVK